LDFKVDSSGGVTTRFDCSEIFQSYTGFIHGGIISLLLDGAMTNCLFARKKKAVTGMLSVRYLQPVVVNRMADISARLVKSAPPLYYLEAEILQDGEMMAKATGKFMEVSARSTSGVKKRSDKRSSKSARNKD
jgi:acyl-coenzyme A thioesterase PaaI-like protein